jgi:hypothetical protein
MHAGFDIFARGRLAELSPNLGDGRGQAAAARACDLTTAIPTADFTARTTFGKWLRPSRRRQRFSAASASLKIVASAVLFDRYPLERTVRWRTVANELSITFVGRRCFPMLGREVVESQQRVAILARALDCLVLFDAPGLPVDGHRLNGRAERRGLTAGRKCALSYGYTLSKQLPPVAWSRAVACKERCSQARDASPPRA